MKTKGLSALAVVAILLAAVLAPTMGALSLMNNSNSSVNESSDYGSNTNATDSCSNDTVQSPPPTYNDTTNSSATTQQPTNDTDTTEHHVSDVKERVIVGFKEKPDTELIKEHGGEIKHKYNIISAIAASLPEKAIDALKNNPHVAYIERDYEVQAIDDSLPWGVDRIDAELVWNGTEDGCDITEGRNAGFSINISVIDTGIDYNHPDLADNYKVFGYDFVNGDTDPMDDNGHGTHCAGIIAAVDNDIGVIGVAPEAGLYAVKVLGSSGSGYVSDVIAGIEWSMNNSMNIISMSLGSDSNSTALHDACDAAYNAGLVLVAAAGNDGNPGGSGDNVGYPARYESVIAVAATDINDNRASFSSTGSDVELAAPGDNINSTYPGGGYAVMSGTSMACPHVTGTAALVWYAYPEYSNTEVRQRMQGTAEDLGDAGRDTWYGYGLVDAEKAADTTPPASVTELKASAVCGTWINWTWNDPPDADFSHVIVHLNGTFKTNVSKGLRFYNATGLAPDTSYEIATHTVDTAGNVNETWVNQTVETNAGIEPLQGGDPLDTWESKNLGEFDESTAADVTFEILNASENKPDFSGKLTKFAVKIDVTNGNKLDDGDGIECAHCEADGCADSYAIGSITLPGEDLNAEGLHWINSTNSTLLARIEHDGSDSEFIHCWWVGTVDKNDALVADIYVDFDYTPNTAPEVQTPSTYDNSTLTAKTTFGRNEGMFINVSVTDADGQSDLSTALITILNTTGAAIVNNDTMTQDTPITNGYVYNYSWQVPSDADLGTWTINVYANDTTNVWDSNSTTFTVQDVQAPQWSDTKTNKTTIYQNDYVKFGANWTDDIGLAGYIFSINQSEEWENSSFVSFNGTFNTSENVTQITASAGTTVQWRFYGNDTSNNWNATDIQSFVVATPPPPPSTPYMIYGRVFYNNGTACNNFTVNITNLNNSKQWTAETNASYNYYRRILANGTDLNASEILRFNVRDSSGVQSKMFNHTITEEEVNNGGLFNLNITLEAPETPFMIYGWVFYADGSECNGSTVNITNTNTSITWQAETNASYNFYQLILGTTNISTGNVLEFNATDGSQYNTLNHTVTQKDITDGGIFDLNLTIGIKEPVNIRNYNNSSDLDSWAFSGGMGENVTVSWQNSSNGTPTCVIWNSGPDNITVCIYAANFTDGDGVQFNPNATEKIVVRNKGNATPIVWSVVTDYVSNKNESSSSWYNFTLEAGEVRDVYLQLYIPMNVESGTYNSTFYAKKKE